MLGVPGRGDGAVLVEDLARLLVGLRVVALPLERRERAQRGARDVGARGQHLQRGDQGVAPEQRVVAARVALRHRRRRRVDPAVGREQRVEALDAHDVVDHGALPGAERQRAVDRLAVAGAVGGDRPPGPRTPSTVTSASERLSATDVALAAPPRPRAGGRGQRLVGAAAQVGLRPAQRDQVAREVQLRAGVAALGGDVEGRRVPDRQPRLDPGLGEARARLGAPLHRRPAGVAVALRLAGAPRHRVERVRGVERDVGQADLVAVVEERRAAQRQQHHHREPGARRIALRPARGEAARVVVGARPHRPRRRRQPCLDPLDDRAHRLRLELRVHEQEVEGEVELVLALAVERHQLREVEHVGLPHEDPLRVRLVGDRAPAPQDVVDLGPVHREHLLVPARLDRAGGRPRSPRGRRAARGP